MSEEPQPTEAQQKKAARLFDIRRVMGGLFVAYGLIVGTVGLLDGDAEIAKGQGVRINLWAGIGMLLLGVFFLVWQFVRPAEAPSAPQPEAESEPDGAG